MLKRFKQLMLVATLGVLLSVVFSGTAVAEPTVSFTVSQPSQSAPSTVTVTDTSSNPDGYELTYEWEKGDYGTSVPGPDVQAGSPECLNANCSQARWTYNSPGTYSILEQVSWPGNPWPPLTWGQEVVVAPAPFTEPAPADITLVGPTRRQLPSNLELLSPKTHLRIEECYFGERVTETVYEPCYPYFVREKGPDENGQYSHVYRLPMAPPGEIHLKVAAWGDDLANADIRELTFTVTGNRFKYGDFRTCIDVSRSRSNYPALIAYYARMTTKVVFRLEEKVRQDGHWVWKARKTRRQAVEIGEQNYPYERHYVRFRVPVDLLPPKEAHYTKGYDNKRYNQRLVRGMYLIKKGQQAIKKGYVAARKPCPELEYSSERPSNPMIYN